MYLAKLLPPDGAPQVVAVKMLHRRWSDNAEIASRMRDEARLLACLHHENIVEVLDFAVIDGRSAVVMEVLEAVDLRILLDHCTPNHALVPVAAALQIAACVARALDAAYNQPGGSGGRPLRVIHRDIKPSNVMVDARGRVKVLDFGVARADFDAREARTAELAFGSLEYMPPERLFFEPESAASDVYSLGTALYELLALQKLGKAKLRQSEQEKFLSERFADLVERHPMPEGDFERDLVRCIGAMLAFDESQRPSAAQAARDLDALAARARALGVEGIGPWAAQTIPALIERSRVRFQGGGTMIGRTLTEDPLPAGAAGRRQQPDPDAVAEEDAALLELDDSDHDGATLRVFAAGEERGLEEAETAFHTDLMARDELIEGVLDDPYGLDDTAWTALEQQTLDALGNTRVGEEVVPVRRALADGFDRPGQPSDRWDDTGAETVRMPVAPVGGPTPAWTEADTVLVPLAEADTLMQVPMYLDGVEPSPPSEPRPRTPSPPPGSARARRSVPPVARTEGARPSGTFQLRAVHLIGAGMLLLAVGVMIGSTLAVSGVGLAAISLPGPRGLAPPPSPRIEVMPPLKEGAGSGVVFRSLLPGTRRILVRCDGASEAGVDKVQFAGRRFSQCTVTAVDEGRQRKTAVLTDPEPRTYVCFGDPLVDGCE